MSSRFVIVALGGALMGAFFPAMIYLFDFKPHE